MQPSISTTLLILLLLLQSLAAQADPGCYANGYGRYQETLRKPFEDIEEPDTSGLTACANAMIIIGTISSSISLVSINIGTFINIAIQAAISGICEFIDGKVKNAVGAVNGAIAQANAGMADALRQRDILIDQVNRSNVIEFQRWQTETVNNNPQIVQ